MINVVENLDCMEGMKRYPDKYFELAIVDPPYGIDMSQEMYKRGQSCQKNGYKEHLNKDWDKQVPDEKYFTELFRVSKNQIIWGGNYFNLPISSCWIVWNKVQRGFSFADGELAWTSFDTALKIFDYGRGNESGFAPKLKGTERSGINIHPTQKPIGLYSWILDNYANCKTCHNEGGFYEDVVGDGGSRMWVDCENCDRVERGQPKILDTHVGSGSSRIACHKAGYDFQGFELDKDYWEAQEKRYKDFCSQGVLEFA